MRRSRFTRGGSASSSNPTMNLRIDADRSSGQRLRLRRHAGYDHGYFFIQTFIEDHLRHHAAQLT